VTKDTPAARAVRTAVLALAGFAAAWATIDWVTDWRAGAAVVTLNVVTAGLAGIVAYLQALGSLRATTAFGKAVASFAQVAGPGLAAVALTELSRQALINTGRGVSTTLIGATVTAIATYLQNRAEDVPA